MSSSSGGGKTSHDTKQISGFFKPPKNKTYLRTLKYDGELSSLVIQWHKEGKTLDLEHIPLGEQIGILNNKIEELQRIEQSVERDTELQKLANTKIRLAKMRSESFDRLSLVLDLHKDSQLGCLQGI